MVFGCSPPVDTELAELAARQFHESYNRGNFTTIYANASPVFQDFVSENKFIRLLRKLHTRLGKHKNSTLINWSAKSSTRGGVLITLVYDAVYDSDDRTQASFTFRINNGLARLYNFNVSSQLLRK
ncbi:MAG: hypothetical protein COB49_05245 [Alphaproteobacteria bacterium]|nr:MAG: hypothetical protein COB49_05245 [Alphaproteobacteria bacterium]